MRITLIIKTLHLESLLAQEGTWREFDLAAVEKEIRAHRINKTGPTIESRTRRLQR